MTLTRRQNFILTALHHRGPLLVSGIAHATGISPGYVRRNLRPLAAWGHVENDDAPSGARWAITPTGRRDLTHHARTGDAA